MKKRQWLGLYCFWGELQLVRERKKRKSEAIIILHEVTQIGSIKMGYFYCQHLWWLQTIQAAFHDLPYCNEKTCIKSSWPPCLQSLLFVSFVSAVMLTAERRRGAVRPLGAQALPHRFASWMLEWGPWKWSLLPCWAIEMPGQAGKYFALTNGWCEMSFPCNNS